MSNERQNEIEYAFNIARKAIDDTGYGGWVRDDAVRDLTARVVNGIEDRRKPPYGKATAEKIKLFQKAQGLNADGVLGDQTWNRIEKLLPKPLA